MKPNKYLHLVVLATLLLLPGWALAETLEIEKQECLTNTYNLGFSGVPECAGIINITAVTDFNGLVEIPIDLLVDSATGGGESAFAGVQIDVTEEFGVDATLLNILDPDFQGTYVRRKGGSWFVSNIPLVLTAGESMSLQVSVLVAGNGGGIFVHGDTFSATTRLRRWNFLGGIEQMTLIAPRRLSFQTIEFRLAV